MPNRTAASIFNDVIGPVMRGPSSSHSAAGLRIGRIARDLMGGVIREVVVEFDRSGSLPTTHESQGSDMGLFGGLLGWDAADERLRHASQAIVDAGIEVRFGTVDVNDPHPNTYRLTLANENETHHLVAVSTGGGMIEVLEVDGAPCRMDGGEQETLIWVPAGAEVPSVGESARLHESASGRILQVSGCTVVESPTLSAYTMRRIQPVLPVSTRAGTPPPFLTCNEMLARDAGAEVPLWQRAVEYECARAGWSEDEVVGRMREIVRILRGSIGEGLQGTDYDDRLLGAQSVGFADRLARGQLLEAGALNRMTLYVTALMEVKSSLGVIVAMPTAGSCAALPGAVIAMAETMDLNETAMAQALLAAGLIGIFITEQWTFAAEAGGCQTECGAASSMAAAGLVTLAGGSLSQACTASSLALQNVIGLVCDPIANRVEAPCLGRNVMAASNALSCANMALAGYTDLVPLDEVIAAAKAVGDSMPRELCCTALGGLSVTPASQKLKRALKARRGDQE